MIPSVRINGRMPAAASVLLILSGAHEPGSADGLANPVHEEAHDAALLALLIAQMAAEDLVGHGRDGPVNPLRVRPATLVDERVVCVPAEQQE